MNVRYRTVVVGVCFLLFAGPLMAQDTLPGDFDDSGTYTPDDPKVESTYEIPDIDAGFTWDPTTNRVRGTFGLELMDHPINEYVPTNDRWGRYNVKHSALLAEDMVGYGVQMRITSILEISAGPTVFYDTEEKSWEIGAVGLMTRF